MTTRAIVPGVPQTEIPTDLITVSRDVLNDFRESLLAAVKKELSQHLEISRNAEQAGRANILQAVVLMQEEFRHSMQSLKRRVDELEARPRRARRRQA